MERRGGLKATKEIAMAKKEAAAGPLNPEPRYTDIYHDDRHKRWRRFTRKVREHYGISGENGAYRASASWCPTIDPLAVEVLNDGTRRNPQLDAWVAYWLGFSNDEGLARAKMAIIAVVGSRAEFGVPAEYPEMFDGSYNPVYPMPTYQRQMKKRLPKGQYLALPGCWTEPSSEERQRVLAMIPEIAAMLSKKMIDDAWGGKKRSPYGEASRQYQRAVSSKQEALEHLRSMGIDPNTIPDA
jgi:hypothetical protein